jgi:hypothetical protein
MLVTAGVVKIKTWLPLPPLHLEKSFEKRILENMNESRRVMRISLGNDTSLIIVCDLHCLEDFLRLPDSHEATPKD